MSTASSPKDCFSLTRGLSGNQIKILGVLMMVADHLYYMFNSYGVPSWFHLIGRPVAPIFLFICAEGFFYTRSRTRYLLQLLIAFEAMNVISTLLGRFLPNENIVLMFSIFGSLFFAALYMLFITMFSDAVRAKNPAKAALAILFMLIPLVYSFFTLTLVSGETEKIPRWLSTILLIFIPNIITVEGGPLWALLGALFFMLRRRQILQIIPLIVFGALFFVLKNNEWLIVFAAIPVLLYNGTRGKGGAVSKYFFYIFYPAHIYLFYIIAYLVK